MCIRTSPSRWLMQSLIVSVVFAGAAYSQTQTQPVPNISGTWELVDIDGNRDNANPKFPKMKLVIDQGSDQLKITEKRIKQGKEEVRTFVYQTGGQGDTNTSRVEVWRTESPTFESVTRIDKNRIVTEFKPELGLVTGTSRTSIRGSLYLPSDNSKQRKDEWSLDGSGKTLTLKTHVINIQSPNAIGRTMSSSEPLNSENDRPQPRTDFTTSRLKFRRI